MRNQVYLKVNKFLFSLILCVYGKKKEYLNFLYSLKNQKYKNFELIIVDQNKIPISKPKNFSFKIKIVRSKPGLSISRNLGIKYSRGKYLAFPDDDCAYMDNTLKIAYKNFSNNNGDIITGITVNKFKKKTLLKYPNKKKLYTKLDIVRSLNSISFFVKKKNILFDKNLGLAGKRILSGEETDYVLRYVKKFKSKVYFDPDLKIFHDENKFNYKNKSDLSKINLYGRGFRKTMFKNNLYLIYFVFLFKNVFDLILSLIFFDKRKIYKTYYSIKGKIY